MRTAFLIARKDLQVELAKKSMLMGMLIFALLVVVVFSVILVDGVSYSVFAGVLWITIYFSGILGLNRSFGVEKNNDCLAGLMLAPVERGSIYLGKFLANLLVLLILEIVFVPLLFMMVNLQWQGHIGYLMMLLFLGSFGFAAIGTFLAYLALYTKASDVMLPVLLFPVLLPLVIGSVQATGMILEGIDEGFHSWVKLIIAYDILFLVVPYFLFDYLVEV